MKYMNKGDPMKALEYAAPKGIRSMLESVRLGTEGYSLSNGTVVMDPREFDISSLMLNSLGLPATEIQKNKRGQRAIPQKN